MLKELFLSLSGKKPEFSDTPRFDLGNGYYFRFDHVSNGYGGYRPINMYLLRENDSKFFRCIIDSNGIIQHFPGIEEGDWLKELEYPLDKKVRFDFWICDFKDGKAQVRWTLQPDGRYFEDEDGFGAEKCEEVCLYSYLDKKGVFTQKFAAK